MSTWLIHRCLVCGCTWNTPDSALIYPVNSMTPCDHYYSSVINDGTVEMPDEEEEDDDPPFDYAELAPDVGPFPSFYTHDRLPWE